ncbi:MAG: YifB family Mg chelatase-like AAA ATPase [Lachnospiraceae bacterium]|nr:YifB family Mg chelatase-like AAA ATPase [Lachnospiraceae bacterium]
MYSTVMTSMIDGIHAVPIHVEVDISTGMPVFDMVGYLSPEVREAKERVRTALHNCGILLPARRITVNLSPGDKRKSGTCFDLAIAAGILAALELVPQERLKGMVLIGELNLSGQLMPVKGVLPMVSDGFPQGKKRFLVPAGNLREGCLVKDAEVLGFASLLQVIEYLRSGSYAEPVLEDKAPCRKRANCDFSEVNGQKFLKRAAEVAASGMHNMLMVGPPGAGKTMISERMASILPPLTEQEELELSRIYSVCGLLTGQEGLLSERPFRSPHHTISTAGLAGGGMMPKPGEISLAHNGVLYLDELTEFSKATLEVLRQPLEEHRIHLSRASCNVVYPANFLLLASMNPCSCGYYPDRNRCRCSQPSLRRYFDRISQPLLDRMDICMEAPGVSYQELVENSSNESSGAIRDRVILCHEIQRKRYEGENIRFNSRIPAARIRDFCRLGEKEERYMENMFQKMELTARTYHKILRVARTIADMEQSADIRLSHLHEAVCYRSMDERFWGGQL